ncbi:GTP cyclohydrolase II [Rhodococcus sp. MEB064]|uniref:GTP cyclohydrolase II n=1 Tax=Rhodococcus sp. MEB064 TaxID=1587522 RepID=UPI0005AD1DFF|nr:GTP cyclohydrolase II [Rhodococcus sp. MEB064]KIQ14171.1 GTP cyclohydrolase [Rhodococcus sp. MEB064]
MSNITAALTALAHRGMVLVVDDEDRENEGDLIMAAEYAETSDVAFFLSHTSGFLCVAITEKRASELNLDLMVENNTEALRTAFLVSVDYRHGTTTGISAGDRAATIRALADPAVVSTDLARPGHVLPLLARPRGVLERAGHTEAGVDLCTMAGLNGAALLCEVTTADRHDMMRRPELELFAREHGIPIVTIADVQKFRRDSEVRVVESGRSTIPTDRGEFDAIAYRSTDDGLEHLVLTMGDVTSGIAPLVRVHSECITGDLVGSLRCDCGPQFQDALDRVAQAGSGVIIYMRGHEGRGIGLGSKLRAYELQRHEGLDTVDANISLGYPIDSRDYRIACLVLKDLGIESARIMTNNPAKVKALADCGMKVEQVPHEVRANRYNRAYLSAKRDRMGHVLQLLD